jgi:hypothetical protein
MDGVLTTTITREDAMMIQDLEDFCLWVSSIVNDICQRIAPLVRRPCPAPTTGSDSELIAMALIGECRGYDMETDLLSFFADHHDLFPLCRLHMLSSVITARTWCSRMPPEFLMST